jgi:hypothetical protein
VAVVATLSKGYDLESIWKQVDRARSRTRPGITFRPARVGENRPAAGGSWRAGAGPGAGPGRRAGSVWPADSIYYDRSRDRWTGTITVGEKPDGRRDRITVRGKTKTEVKDKLRAKHLELAAGIRTPASYTVEQCLKDWLETLNTLAQSTLTGYRITVR